MHCIGNASCKLIFQNINQKTHIFCIVVQKLYVRTIYDRFIWPNTLNVFTKDNDKYLYTEHYIKLLGKKLQGLLFFT
jgi:hypothetical protein